MTSVTLNGNTYSDDDNPDTGLANGGHRLRFVPALADMLAELQAIKLAGALSTSTVAIATGAKTFTLTAPANLPAGSYRAYSIATPENFMIGTLVADALAATDITLEVAITGGSGSPADWCIVPVTRDNRPLANNRTSAYTVTAGDHGSVIDCTSGTFTVSLPAAATLKAGFWCWIANSGNGVITIDPAGSETIDGTATAVLPAHDGRLIFCDGSGWVTLSAVGASLDSTGKVPLAQLPTLTPLALTRQSVTAATTTTINLSSGWVIDLTHGTNITNLSFTNAPASGTYCLVTLIRKKDSSSTARTITWPSSVKWHGSVAPTLTTLGSGVDEIQMVTTDGGTTWYATRLVQWYGPQVVAPYYIGNNYWGEMGDGTSGNVLSTPTQGGDGNVWRKICTTANYDNTTNYNGFSIGIRHDGTLWATGRNNVGQLGQGNTTNQTNWVQIGTATDWVDVSAHWNGTWLAVKSNGTLWACGYGGYGGLGDGTTVDKSSPVQIGSLTNWAKVHAVYGQSMGMALKTDGSLWTWGGTGYGLGDTTAIAMSRSSPVQLGTASYSMISGHYQTGIALRTDGSLWVWGRGDACGALGQNGTSNYSSMVQFKSGTSFVFAHGSAYGIWAIDTLGQLWAAGGRPSGNLGDGTTVAKSSPVQIAGSWALIGGVWGVMGGIKAGGTLWLWGDGSFGDGFGGTTSRSSPTQYGSGTNWFNVEGNGYATRVYTT